MAKKGGIKIINSNPAVIPVHAGIYFLIATGLKNIIIFNQCTFIKTFFKSKTGFMPIIIPLKVCHI